MAWMKTAGLAVAIVVAVVGCATGTMYEWGDYEDSLYSLWIEPDSYDPADTIRRLGEQIQETEAAGRLVPPGMRAHLAFLFLDAGDQRSAADLLLAEKRAYPEAAVLVDGMLARMRR